MLTQDELFTLRQLSRTAKRYIEIGDKIEATVVACVNQGNLEGLDEMLAYSFNATTVTPQYGGGSGGLPVGKYKGIVLDITQENVVDKTTGQVKGGYFAFKLVPIEGPLANTGANQIDRLNVLNSSAQAAQIAQQQLSAYCHVLGVLQGEDLHQLLNIPFLFEVGYQKGQEPTQEKPEGGYTEVKAIYDVNGNPPGKQGNNQRQQQNGGQQQQQGFPQQGQDNGGVAPASNAASGWGPNGNASQGQDQTQQGGGQGGWGAPQGQGGGGGGWGPR